MSPPLVGLILGASCGGAFALFLLASLYQFKKALPSSLLSIRSELGVVRFIGPIMFFTHAVWSLFGMTLGFVYSWVQSLNGGSSTTWFSVIILAIAGSIVCGCFLWCRPYWLWILPIPILLPVAFVWLLPMITV